MKLKTVGASPVKAVNIPIEYVWSDDVQAWINPVTYYAAVSGQQVCVYNSYGIPNCWNSDSDIGDVTSPSLTKPSHTGLILGGVGILALVFILKQK